MFKNPDFGAHTQPPVLHDGHFYAHYTINERSDGLVAMSMDGQIKWKTDQQPPFVRGGSILADGLLLMTDGNTKLYLVEPRPAGFKPLASAVILEPGDNRAPLALVDGKLLVRGTEGVEGPAGREVSAQNIRRQEIAVRSQRLSTLCRSSIVVGAALAAFSARRQREGAGPRR